MSEEVKKSKQEHDRERARTRVNIGLKQCYLYLQLFSNKMLKIFTDNANGYYMLNC